jgi:transcriptional regulator with XRE-family HTH domain
MPAKNKIDRERVRQLLAQGLTQRQVCLRLGVNKSTVSNIAAAVRQEGKS